MIREIGQKLRTTYWNGEAKSQAILNTLPYHCTVPIRDYWLKSGSCWTGWPIHDRKFRFCSRGSRSCRKGSQNTCNPMEARRFQLLWTPDNPVSNALCEKLWKVTSSAKSLAEIQKLLTAAAPELDQLTQYVRSLPEKQASEALVWIDRLKTTITAGADAAESLDQRLHSLARQAEELAAAMDFRMLFQPTAEAVFDRVSIWNQDVWTVRTMTCCVPKRDWPVSGDRQRRCRSETLVPSGSADDASDRTTVAAVVGRHHVRISDAASVPENL